jgi:hypothetical protein
MFLEGRFEFFFHDENKILLCIHYQKNAKKHIFWMEVYPKTLNF